MIGIVDAWRIHDSIRNHTSQRTPEGSGPAGIPDDVTDLLRVIRDEILEKPRHRLILGEYYTQIWRDPNGRLSYEPLEYDRCQQRTPGGSCTISPEGMSSGAELDVHSHPLRLKGEVRDDLAPSDFDKALARKNGPGAIIDPNTGRIQIYDSSGPLGPPFR